MSQRLGSVVKKKYFCILKHLKIENNINRILRIKAINGRKVPIKGEAMAFLTNMLTM